MWIDTPPARCHPLVADDRGVLTPDAAVVVELFPLRPDLPLQAFVTWSGGDPLIVGGSTAVLLPGTRPAATRLVGMGDYAARDGADRTWAEPAAGIAQRYCLTGVS